MTKTEIEMITEQAKLLDSIVNSLKDLDERVKRLEKFHGKK